MEIIRTIYTLKARLVFLFSVLALAPLATIGAFSIHTNEALIESLVLRQLENVAADKAAILERWLEERREDLQVIAGTSLLKSMDPQVIGPYLELIQNHYGVYKNLAVISAANEMVFSIQEPAPAVDIVSWNRSAGPRALFLSGITYLPEAKESTFHIAAPVFDGDKRVGTVLGTVGTSKIIYMILKVSLGETGECYLVDNNGIFLAHKEPRRILAENISQSGSFKNIFGSRDPKKTYLDYRNIEVLGTSRKIRGTDWYLVVEQDRDEAFESVEILKHSIYFTIFLAIGSALILTWVISYHVARPIRRLSQSAQNLALTAFDAEVAQTSRRDEIGLLYRAFAEMARKIRERQDTLEKQFHLKEAELKETDHTLQQFKLVAERSERFVALGRLGAAVAHEIRTPLTAIKLFLESVQAEIEISSEYAEDFAIAMDQIARIEAAINRLLEFTKPRDLIFSSISVSQLISDVSSMVRPLANKQECVVEVHIEDDLPRIEADRKLLEEALVNLMINSLEAMAGKGRVIVTAARDGSGLPGDGRPHVRIDVKDTGPGISSDSIDLIFEPFFTTKSAGTGLGLPMVLNTVKRHAGEIRVTSHEKSGTVFSLFLPIQSGGTKSLWNESY